MTNTTTEVKWIAGASLSFITISLAISPPLAVLAGILVAGMVLVSVYGVYMQRWTEQRLDTEIEVIKEKYQPTDFYA